MPHNPPTSAAEVQRLRQNVAQLRETVRLLEEERDVFISRRFRRLLFFCVGISIICHVSLMIYLNMIERGGFGSAGGSGRAFANVEFAIVNEEELTDNEDTTFDELETDATSAESPDEAASALEPDVGMASAAATTDTSLGATGSGDGGGFGLGGTGGAGGEGGFGLGGGGGGAASFFGLGAKGQRFAYIVDVSGSMGQNHKLEIAMRELARSLNALPDFAYFHVILFESQPVVPPMQKGWMRARKSIVRQIAGWLSDIGPNGGTEPRHAFLQAFALDARPDVIFFLTDGIFGDISLEDLKSLNSQGKKVVINTIGFGAPGEVDQSLLRAIAQQTGGEYRFVATGSAP